MKKNIIWFTIGISIVASISPSFAENDISMLSYSITNSAVTITNCNSDYIGSIKIPDMIEGYPVVTIGEQTFRDCKNLARVTLPGSLRTIEAAAFLDCDSMTNMIIPDSVELIGDSAIRSCNSLKNLTIGNNVSFIGANAFMDNDGLNSVIIPNSVTNIGRYAFSFCGNLRNVTFEGDAPDVFGDFVFHYAYTFFKLYFYEGATGFTTPKWNNYSSYMVLNPRSFNGWVSAYPEGQRGDADCPDGDHIPNLLKYAAGLQAGTAYATDDLFSFTCSSNIMTMLYWKGNETDRVALYPTFSESIANSPSLWITNGINNMVTGETDTEGVSDGKLKFPAPRKVPFFA